MSTFTIIGRGHSGTRVLSHTLYASGVYMGGMINSSGDLVPAEDMYEACRIIAKRVRWLGDYEWCFDNLNTGTIDDEFTSLVERYLSSVLTSKAKHKAWKLPETTLAFPWIARMFPNIKYIHCIRNPRDVILRPHLTDRLDWFGVECPRTDDLRLRRALSWKYQYDLVTTVPRPEYWLDVRFEDFVLRQEETLARLQDFLGIHLARIVVRPEAVDRWRSDDSVNYFEFFAPAMREYDYAIPVFP